MVHPVKLLLLVLASVAGLALGAEAVAGTTGAHRQTSVPAAAGCPSWVVDSAAQVSLLSDAVPSDVGARVCGLLDTLQGLPAELG